MPLQHNHELRAAIRAAMIQTRGARRPEVECRDVFHGLLEDPNNLPSKILRRAGVDLEGLKGELRREVADVQSGTTPLGAETFGEPAAQIEYSAASRSLLDDAERFRENLGRGVELTALDVLHAIFDGTSYRYGKLLLWNYGLDWRRYDLGHELAWLIPQDDAPGDQAHFKEFVTYATKVHGRTADPEWGSVVGRDAEVCWAAKTLGRITCNNVVFVGEPGVGKTAAAHGLARRIVDAPVGDPLHGKRVIGIDVAAMRTGGKYRDEFVSRLTEVLKTARRANGRIILFVGAIRDFFDANFGWASPKGVTAALVPLFQEGSLQIVGTATPAEFKKLISDDPALRSYFAPIPVEAPDADAAVEMLAAAGSRLERMYRVKLTDGAVRAAVELSERHISDRNLPAKAVDLMDEAAAMKRPDAASADADPEVVDADDIRRLVGKRYGKSKDRVFLGDGLKLADIEARLRSRVAGQEPAISVVVDSLASAMAGLTPRDKPIGTFLFMGPSGVGKTEFARALAKILTGDVENLIQIDMSEIASPWDVSRLTGGSPNYVGYREGGQLTNAVKENPRSVILLDEVEKADAKAFDLLLQVFDRGRLTDGQGAGVDFCQTIIIMTSNLGSSEVVDLGAFTAPSSAGERGLPLAYERAIKRTFRPEFINRIDDIVVFQPLYRESLMFVIHNRLNELRGELADRGVCIELTSDARDWLLELPRDPMKGARPVIRAFKRHVVDAVARRIADDRITDRSTVLVDAVDGQLTFASVPAYALAWTFQQAMSMTRAYSRVERRGSELKFAGGAIEHLAMLVRQAVDRDPPIQLEFCVMPDALGERMVRHHFGDRGYVHLRRVLERHVEAAVEEFVESHPYLDRTDVVVDVEDGEVTVA